MSSESQIKKMAQAAKAASQTLALVSTSDKNKVLKKMAESLLARQGELLDANQKDLKAARKAKYSKALVDRLTLNEKRVAQMAQCLSDTANLHDPVGEVLQAATRPNGLLIKKVRVPFGVVGIIFESRPNVTSDCIGLCLKSGNAVILKGGKEALHSNRAIFTVLRDALKDTNIPEDSVQLISSTDRAALKILLKLDKEIDLIVPRGGEGLIRFVAENSSIPVVKHYKGICHTYVSDKADLGMAQKICFNAKVQRPGVCNAMETMLVHRNVAESFLPPMLEAFQNANVEIRGCPATRRIFKKGVKAVSIKDWDTEYLDLILSVRVVNSLKEAVGHINTHGTRHSDTIVTQDQGEAEEFLKKIDSACVYVNASTRFTDGYEFGFGAEVGISTDKLHARGPMGLQELTTYKYLVYGQGQVRT